MTVEKQLGRAWQVGASYLGSYTDRLWNQLAINPGVFLGLGPARSAACVSDLQHERESQPASRVLVEQRNPAAALLIGNLDIHTNLGTQSYRGLKLSFQRRAGSGRASVATIRCRAASAIRPSRPAGSRRSQRLTDPAHPEFDRGPCDQDRTHIGVFNAGVQVPRFDNRAARVALSDWRVAGIFSARSDSQ